MVLVHKPDGSILFCVDFRKLNSATVTESYHLSIMEDCIESLGEATVLSTLDCNGGFWEVPIPEENKNKTAFVCYAGTYR